jgi:hypothetical protein
MSLNNSIKTTQNLRRTPKDSDLHMMWYLIINETSILIGLSIQWENHYYQMEHYKVKFYSY